MRVSLNVRVADMLDLADYLHAEVKQTSLRDVASKTGVSKSAIDNIIKRQIRRLPKIETLQRLADYYKLSLPTIVEMAGAVMGGDDRYLRLARELETKPWIADRFDELARLSREVVQMLINPHLKIVERGVGFIFGIVGRGVGIEEDHRCRPPCYGRTEDERGPQRAQENKMSAPV